MGCADTRVWITVAACDVDTVVNTVYTLGLALDVQQVSASPIPTDVDGLTQVTVCADGPRW